MHAACAGTPREVVPDQGAKYAEVLKRFKVSVTFHLTVSTKISFWPMHTHEMLF